MELTEGMRALVFDGSLQVVEGYPVPTLKPGWARIRVRLAGICRTDSEIIKGYSGFHGVLGHEFVGTVEACDDGSWVGRRVVGEINVGCGHCELCAVGLERHCCERRALGIHGLDGCMADFCRLPVANLHAVPQGLPDEAAVLIEPLAAAAEILDQVPLQGHERVCVLGDGRLGILCAWVLATQVEHVTLVGHHAGKLAAAKWRHLRTIRDSPELGSRSMHLVVEATGSPAGLKEAVRLCRPRGVVVLKSTISASMPFDMAPVVTGEITLQGSRCGRFVSALALIAQYADLPFERLITASYPLAQAQAAFERAAHPDALKVVLTPD